MNNEDIAASVIFNQINAIRRHFEHTPIDEQILEVMPTLQRYQRKKDLTKDFAKWLKNSWNTERVLRISHDLLQENSFALQWSFPQAYYAVFCSLQALITAQGNSCQTHQTALKDFSAKIQQKMYPLCMSFSVSGGLSNFSFHNLAYDAKKQVLSYNQFDEESVISQIGHFLSSTRNKNIDEAKKEARSNNKKFRTKNGAKPHRLTKEQSEEVAKKVENTTLLHLLYRKRIKSNYRDVDVFQSENLDASRINADLAYIVSRINFFHELFLSQIIGRQRFQEEYALFDPNGEIDWLRKRIDKVIETKPNNS